MADEPTPQTLDDDPPCGARAQACVCDEVGDHVDLDGTPHVCHCGGGEWRGTFGGEDFASLREPGNPRSYEDTLDEYIEARVPDFKHATAAQKDTLRSMFQWTWQRIEAERHRVQS